MSRTASIRGALARGLGAGLAGTAAMTAWQELAARLNDAGDGEPQAGQDPWERASVPAQVAARAIERVAGRRPPPERIPLLTHATHWAYGAGWGVVFGLARRDGRGRVAAGLPFGAAVWALSYLQLVPLGFYEPPWRYPAKALALDLSYHLVYGAGVAAGYRALTRV